jgi:hypothetical protein
MKGMLRPAQTVMPDSALEPEADVVSPPPNRFTHVVRQRQPFYVGSVLKGEAGGMMAAGAKVVLMVRGRGDVCRVIDRRGRYVTTSCKGLRRLS